MPEPASKTGSRFTYADYRSWSDDERWELIDGVAFNMVPAPGRLHQRVSIALSSLLYDFLKSRECEVYEAPFDVRLPREGEDDDDVSTVVQPDIVVVCDREKLDDRGCRGAPDFVVEIVSPASAVRDQRDKVVLYSRAGVHEYWVVHPVDRLVYVRHLTEHGTYGPPEVFAAEDTVEVATLPGLSVRLAEIFE